MVLPEVVGYKLYGNLPSQATSTDLVLTVTQVCSHIAERWVTNGILRTSEPRVLLESSWSSTVQELHNCLWQTEPQSPTCPQSTEPLWASSQSTKRPSTTYAKQAAQQRTYKRSNPTCAHKDCSAISLKRLLHPRFTTSTLWSWIWEPSYHACLDPSVLKTVFLCLTWRPTSRRD